MNDLREILFVLIAGGALPVLIGCGLVLRRGRDVRCPECGRAA